MQINTNVNLSVDDTSKALGGFAFSSNITEALQNLYEVIGTSVELPAVSAADNGKVLRVVNGEWNKAY